MDEHSCLIYEGSCFRIEWFYDENGKSQAYDYFLGTSDSQKRKFLMLVKRMGDAGKIFDKTKFNNELDQIYAFKPKPDRYLCFFFIGKKIIVTNAFCKKCEKLPPTEKEKALKAKADYELKHKEK